MTDTKKTMMNEWTGRRPSQPELQNLPAHPRPVRPELGFVSIRVDDAIVPQLAPFRVPADRVGKVLAILLESYKDVGVRIRVKAVTTAAECRHPFFAADTSETEQQIAASFGDYNDLHTGQGRR